MKTKKPLFLLNILFTFLKKSISMWLNNVYVLICLTLLTATVPIYTIFSSLLLTKGMAKQQCSFLLWGKKKSEYSNFFNLLSKRGTSIIWLSLVQTAILFQFQSRCPKKYPNLLPNFFNASSKTTALILKALFLLWNSIGWNFLILNKLK